MTPRHARDAPRSREGAHRERQELGQQVEGRRAVRELLAADARRVDDVWVAEDSAPAPIVDEILALAEQRRVRVRRAPAAAIQQRARTEAPQGVLAFAAPLPTVELDVLARDPQAFLVALDGVTDPQNLGAVMRTAETAGASGIVLPRHRAAGITPAVTKAAAGAIEHLPVSLVSGIPSALDRLKRAGVWSVGLDAGGDGSIFELTVADAPLVLVLGAEGRGLSRLARARCDVVASIPMRGKLESLNVSAAAAVACYEIARRRGS
jgi:23S rRNA (guanosine2251-2'-O)-methyltransferase